MPTRTSKSTISRQYSEAVLKETARTVSDISVWKNAPLFDSYDIKEAVEYGWEECLENIWRPSDHEPPTDTLLIATDGFLTKLCKYDGEDYILEEDGSTFRPTRYMIVPPDNQ